MKKLILLIALFIIVALGSFLFSKPPVQPESTEPQENEEVITLTPLKRGDIAYYPIEDECQERMEAYIEESEYTTCELISSEIGYTEEECLFDTAPEGGCSVCKIKCE